MAVLPQRILFNGLSQFECVEFTKKKKEFSLQDAIFPRSNTEIQDL